MRGHLISNFLSIPKYILLKFKKKEEIIYKKKENYIIIDVL
jgi:hypothetical protein